MKQQSLQKSKIKFLLLGGVRSRIKRSIEVIEAAGCLRICKNQVELEVASHNDIPVFNLPFANKRSVAALVMAEAILIL